MNVDPGRTRRWRSLLRHAGVAALSTVLALFLAELGLRVAGFSPRYVNALGSFFEFDPELGAVGKPGLDARFERGEFDVRVVHDELGFRKHETPRPPIDRCSRHVFVIGDSYTWGWGVDQGEVFTDVLARAKPDWHVHNLGLAATGTIVHARIFDRFVRDDLSPGDLVVLAAYQNDVVDNVLDDVGRPHAQVDDPDLGIVEPQPVGSMRHVKDVLKDHSYLYNLASFVTNSFRFARELDRAERASAGRIRDAGTGEPVEFPEQSPEARALMRSLRHMQDGCRDAGAELRLVIVPGRAEYGEARSPSEDARAEGARRLALVSVASRLGIPCLDLLPVIRSWKSEDPALALTFGYDFHWTATAHALAARALLRFLDS